MAKYSRQSSSSSSKRVQFMLATHSLNVHSMSSSNQKKILFHSSLCIKKNLSSSCNSVITLLASWSWVNSHACWYCRWLLNIDLLSLCPTPPMLCFLITEPVQISVCTGSAIVLLVQTMVKLCHKWKIKMFFADEINSLCSFSYRKN